MIRIWPGAAPSTLAPRTDLSEKEIEVGFNKDKDVVPISARP
jgi:hypothetical protein